MSVERVGHTPDRIAPRTVVVINQTFTSGIANPTFDVDLAQHQVSGKPRFMTIRQILYSNVPGGADSGNFILWTNAGGVNKNVGATNISVGGAGSLAFTPETVVPLFNYNRTIQFQFKSTTSSQGLNAGAGTSYVPSGNLLLVLEFW